MSHDAMYQTSTLASNGEIAASAGRGARLQPYASGATKVAATCPRSAGASHGAAQGAAQLQCPSTDKVVCRILNSQLLIAYVDVWPGRCWILLK